MFIELSALTDSLPIFGIIELEGEKFYSFISTLRKDNKMTNYEMNPAADLTDALIIIEQPHRGESRVWSAMNEADFLNRTQKAAERSETSCYDMDTFEGAMEWNGHDLKSQTILRFKDLNAEWLSGEIINSGKVSREAVSLGWAVEVADEEEGE